jgi:hypothetical protein
MSYDAWLTTPPEPSELPLPGDPFYPRCGRCGAFLTREPERTEPGEQTDPCDGELHGGMDLTLCGRPRAHDPHPFTAHTWSENHRACKRCGHDNTEIS